MSKGGILRDWFKAPTNLLNSDPRYRRLSFEERGIWWSALQFSLASSPVPGMFLTQEDGPMPLDDVADLLNSPGDMDLARTVVGRAFAKFGQLGLMDYTPTDGWSINRWLEDYSVETQRAATREAAKNRQARRRQRLRDAARRNGSGAATDVVDIATRRPK